MIQLKRLTMMLALLLTAAQGAWADDDMKSTPLTMEVTEAGTVQVTISNYGNFPGMKYSTDGGLTKTLTIKGGTAGTGQLWANGGGGAAGIGGGKEIDCGNIIIEGGIITANGTANGGASIGAGRAASCGNITITGGEIYASECNYTAGIGSGYDHSTCGKIIISGGTVYATGGEYAAAIGSGYDVSKCGDILITTGVTKVIVSKPFDNTVYSIGPGNNSTCGTVWIDCTLDTDGNPVGGSKGFKTDSSFIYQPSN